MRSHPNSIQVVRAGGSGFTLVEILIVLVIIAVLAVVVVAQFTSAADEARDSSIQMSLFRIRGQLGIYHAEHSEYPDFDSFVEQMTLSSDEDGNTAAIGTSGYPYGPYLAKIPVNPNTGTNTVGVGEVGTSDWFYDEVDGEFRANDSLESYEY